MHQLCVCVTCNLQMVCYVCTIRNHSGHEIRLMSDLIHQKQKELDSRRMEFMKKVESHDWDRKQTLTILVQDSDIGARCDQAFLELKTRWDATVNEARNIGAKELIITGRFDNYFGSKLADLGELNAKKDRFMAEVQKVLESIKKINLLVADVSPEDGLKGDQKPKRTFIFWVSNISTMKAGHSRKGPSFTIRGLTWKIRLACRQSGSGHKTMGFFVECNAESNSQS